MRFTDRLTILIVPPDDSGIVSFRAAAGALAALTLLFFAGLIALGTTFFQHAAAVRRDEAIARLTSDKTELTRSLGEIRDVVVRLNGRMVELATLERDVRIAADLTAIDPEVRRVGIGGPLALTAAGFAASAPGADFASAVDLRRDVDALVRQARFQRASLVEVAEALELRKESLARTPSILPVLGGTITSPYGKRTDPVTGEPGVHEGVDVGARSSDQVLATARGRIVSTSPKSGYGICVEIDHGNGMATSYSHCSRVFVSAGDLVDRGQVIAAVGSTGRATAPHCHYEVHLDGAPVDPKRYILSSKIIFD